MQILIQVQGVRTLVMILVFTIVMRVQMLGLGESSDRLLPQVLDLLLSLEVVVEPRYYPVLEYLQVRIHISQIFPLLGEESLFDKEKMLLLHILILLIEGGFSHDSLIWVQKKV